MTWESFYFVCFLVGLFLSAFSLLGGMGHFGGHLHLPHAAHVPHLPNLSHAGAHLPHAGAGLKTPQATATVPWWNAFSIMVFLCWFGAAGYLLTRYGGFVAGLVLVLAGVCGLAGGAIVFFFLAKVLLPHERELTADETAVIGVIGRVSAAIRPGGTGEIGYEQMGARHSAPARSDDGIAIQKQEEVFVVRYERGIAYVRRWEDQCQ
jgi:membrane protein implicated in regulation of membrane protease activity